MGVLWFTVLLGGLGCAAHVPAPAVGSAWNPGAHDTIGRVPGESADWILVQTASPGLSWGGEGMFGHSLLHVSHETARVTAVVDLGRRPNRRLGAPVIGHGAVWIGMTQGDLVRVDTLSHAVRVIRVAKGGWWRGHERVPEIAVGAEAVWVLVWGRQELFRVDARHGSVEKVKLRDGLGAPLTLRVDSAAVHVSHDRGTSRIDPRTKSLVAP